MPAHLAAPAFTFGIEEEYHLVHLETRALTPAPDGLVARWESALGQQVASEFLRSQIEVGTRIETDFTHARGELARLRSAIAAEARGFGLAPIAAGTAPLGGQIAIPPTDKARYRALASDLAGVGRRLLICGMHVHVGIGDEALRVDLMNQARYFVAHLLVLSTSSPFWMGEDTGLKSYRSAVKDALPRTGLPGRFESVEEYRATLDVLIRTGVIQDASKIWWDIRPSARFPTLELRAPDVCTRLDDGIAIAALYVCLVRMLWRLRRANQSWRTYPVFLLEENRWRAQRWGVQGSLLDLGQGALVPFADLVEEIIALIAEDAEALGCRREIEHARTIVSEGTSADRQLAVHAAAIARGADAEAALAAVVDDLIATTVAL